MSKLQDLIKEYNDFLVEIKNRKKMSTIETYRLIIKKDNLKHKILELRFKELYENINNIYEQLDNQTTYINDIFKILNTKFPNEVKIKNEE